MASLIERVHQRRDTRAMSRDAKRLRALHGSMLAVLRRLGREPVALWTDGRAIYADELPDRAVLLGWYDCRCPTEWLWEDVQWATLLSGG